MSIYIIKLKNHGKSILNNSTKNHTGPIPFDFLTLTFSANRAYFPSSVTQSPAHFRRCAIKYFRILRCGGKMTEHVSDNSAQCLRLTLEFGSGCSVVCLISCRYNSQSNDSLRIDLSMTFCIRVTCSSSARRTTSPNEN